MKRSLSVVTVAAVLLPLTGGSVAVAAPSTHHLAVTGYALGGTSASVIAASADAMTTVTVDGVSISADGTSIEKPYAGMASVRKIAHQHGLRAELLVSNYSNDLGDFDTDAAHALLSSTANVTKIARTVAGYVKAGHYEGVNIDLELVQSRDAAGLVRFAQAVQDAMPAARSVSIDISAATSVAEYRDQGYALPQLAKVVDVVQLMTYDQHGPGWSGPGPIGDLRWQKSSLTALLSKVPASKVDLGQAGYGYTWPKTGTGHELSDAGARAVVRQSGAKAVWHSDSGEWSATLANGTKLWWADARSYAIRKKYAEAKQLHGLAVWVLGSADTLR